MPPRSTVQYHPSSSAWSWFAQLAVCQAIGRQSRMIRFSLGLHDLFFFLGALAAVLLGGDLLPLHWRPIVFGWLSAICARASLEALNDAIDVERDRVHPVRCRRPVAMGLVGPRSAVAWWVFFSCLAILLACETNPLFAAIALPAWFIGSAHAAAPIKVREFAFVDHLGAALRQPLNLALGWCALGSTVVPPVALFVGVWMLGAFLLAAERLSEQSPADERNLSAIDYPHLARDLSFASFFALAAIACCVLLAMRLRVELIIASPFLGLMAVYYLRLALRKGTRALDPRALCREPIFLALTAALAVVIANSTSSTIPALHDWLAQLPAALR